MEDRTPRKGEMGKGSEMAGFRCMRGSKTFLDLSRDRIYLLFKDSASPEVKIATTLEELYQVQQVRLK